MKREKTLNIEKHILIWFSARFEFGNHFKDFRIRMDVNRCDFTCEFQLDDVNHYEWKYRDRDHCVNFMRALSISFLATIRSSFVDFGEKKQQRFHIFQFYLVNWGRGHPSLSNCVKFFLGLMTIEISISINQ